MKGFRNTQICHKSVSAPGTNELADIDEFVNYLLDSGAVDAVLFSQFVF